MIRPETVVLSAIRGDPQLTHVFGFWWNANHDGNTVTTDAVVTAEVEYVDGRRARLVLRPAVWYGLAREASRIWVTSAASGTVVLEIGDEPGDEVIPSIFTPPTPGPWLEQKYVSAVAQDFTPAPWALVVARPSYADRLTIITRMGRFTSVQPKAEIWPRDEAGTEPEEPLSMQQGDGTTLDIPGATTAIIEQPLALLGHARSGITADGIGVNQLAGIGTAPRFTIPYLPSGGVRFRVYQGNLSAGQVLAVTFRWHRAGL